MVYFLAATILQRGSCDRKGSCKVQFPIRRRPVWTQICNFSRKMSEQVVGRGQKNPGRAVQRALPIVSLSLYPSVWCAFRSGHNWWHRGTVRPDIYCLTQTLPHGHSNPVCVYFPPLYIWTYMCVYVCVSVTGEQSWHLTVKITSRRMVRNVKMYLGRDVMPDISLDTYAAWVLSAAMYYLLYQSYKNGFVPIGPIPISDPVPIGFLKTF